MWFIIKTIKPFRLFSPNLFCIILFITQSVTPYSNPYSQSDSRSNSRLYDNGFNFDDSYNPVKQKDVSPTSSITNKPYQSDKTQENNNQAQQVPKPLNTDGSMDTQLQTTSIDVSGEPPLNGNYANIDDSLAYSKSDDDNKQKNVQLDNNNIPVGIKGVSPTSSITNKPYQSDKTQEKNQAQQVPKPLNTDGSMDTQLQTTSIDVSGEPPLNGNDANIDDSLAYSKSDDDNKQKNVQLDNNNIPVGIKGVSPTSSITNKPYQSDKTQENNQAQQVPKPLNTDGSMDTQLQTTSIDVSGEPPLNGNDANIDDSLAYSKSDDENKQKNVQLDNNNIPVGIKGVSPISSITNKPYQSDKTQENNNQAQQVPKPLNTDGSMDTQLQTTSIDVSGEPPLNGNDANIDDSLAYSKSNDDNKKIVQLDSDNIPVGIKSDSSTSGITNDPHQSFENQKHNEAQQMYKPPLIDESTNKPLEINSVSGAGFQNQININNPTGTQKTDGNDKVVSHIDPSIDNLQNKPQPDSILNRLSKYPKSLLNRNNKQTGQENPAEDQNGTHNEKTVEHIADSNVFAPNSNQNEDITNQEDLPFNSLPNSVVSNEQLQSDNNQENNQAQPVSKPLNTDGSIDTQLQTSSIDGSGEHPLNGNDANIDDSLAVLSKSDDDNKQKNVQLDNNNILVGIKGVSPTSSITNKPYQSDNNQENNQAQQVSKPLNTDGSIDKQLQTSSIDGSGEPPLNGNYANIDDSLAYAKSDDDNKQKNVQLDNNNIPVGIKGVSPTSSITNKPYQSDKTQENNNQAQQVPKPLNTDGSIDTQLQISSIDGSGEPPLNGNDANIDNSLAYSKSNDDNKKIVQLDSDNIPVGIKSDSSTSGITNDPHQSFENQKYNEAQQMYKPPLIDESTNKPLEINSVSGAGFQNQININNPTGTQKTDGNDKVVSHIDPSIDNLQNKPQPDSILNRLSKYPKSLLNRYNKQTGQENPAEDQNGTHNKKTVEQLALADSNVFVPNSNQNHDITHQEDSSWNSLPNEAKTASTLSTEPNDRQQLNIPTAAYGKNNVPSLRTKKRRKQQKRKKSKLRNDITGGTKLDLQQGYQLNEILENSNKVQVKSTEGKLGTNQDMEIIQTSGITTQMDNKENPMSANNNIENTGGQLLGDVNKDGTDQEQNSLNKIPVGLPNSHAASIENYNNEPSQNIIEQSPGIDSNNLQSKRAKKRNRQRENRKKRLQRNMNTDQNIAGNNREQDDQGIAPSINNNNMQVTYTEDQLRIIDDNKIDQNVKQKKKRPKKSANRYKNIQTAKQKRQKGGKIKFQNTEITEQDNQGNAISDNNNNIQGTYTEEKLLGTTEAVESVQTLNQNNGGTSQPENSLDKISVGLSDIQPQKVDKQTLNGMGTIGSSINSLEPIFRQNENYRSNNSAKNTDTIQNDNTATTEIVVSQTINNSNNQVFKKKNNKGLPFKITELVENMRVFCTFLGDVKKMYRKVRKHFVGDLCQAVVFGEPIIIHDREIVLNPERDAELENFHKIKGNVSLIVIIKHPSYEAWSQALDNMDIQAQLIMDWVKKYHIDGIQLSNLQPTAHDQLDTDMLCKLIKFLKALYTIAFTDLDHTLKIGITISSYSQSIVSSFKTFKQLNHLVSWYSIHTISMLKCSTTNLGGTSPLLGPVSLDETIKELMKTNIKKSKIVIGIQLYPNKLGDLKPSSYYQMCAIHQKNGVSFDNWCAARPEEYHSKGHYLRDLEIWGVQLYYMESDDHKAQCQCHSFPMIRALLRGMAADNQTQEYCTYLGNASVLPSQCSYDESEFEDSPNQEQLSPLN